MNTFEDSIVTLMIIAIMLWGAGSFINFCIYAYQWVTCNPYMG
jgi:hypothetical protein